VVTGASSGIGEATARRLAADGWRCVLVARREDRLRALASELGGEAAVCDVGSRAVVDACAAAILARHPRIDLLVNNAGMPARPTYLEAELELVERVLAVNYFGGVWMTRALLPGLRAGAAGRQHAGRHAHVVNIASVAGTVAFARSGPYVAAKHAQVAFSRQLRVALSGSGISVHTVLPGFVETEGFPQAELRGRRATRWLVTTADHVAAAIVDAVAKERAEVTVPWFPYRFVSALAGVLPQAVAGMARAGMEPPAAGGRER